MFVLSLVNVFFLFFMDPLLLPKLGSLLVNHVNKYIFSLEHDFICDLAGLNHNSKQLEYSWHCKSLFVVQ